MSRPTFTRPMEVLLVEDSLIDARVAYAALEQAKFRHRLTWVRDGADALEFLRQQGRYLHAPRPDLLLLDLRLPGLDGLEVLEKLREEFNLTTIPVVVLTGSDSREDMQACRAHGVEHYITKPVDVNQFVDVVRELKTCWREGIVLPAAC